MRNHSDLEQISEGSRVLMERTGIHFTALSRVKEYVNEAESSFLPDLRSWN
jgi:hypothetical protein